MRDSTASRCHPSVAGAESARLVPAFMLPARGDCIHLDTYRAVPSDVWARTRVASNRSTPIPVVVALMGDAAAYVAPSARDRFASWAQETLDLGSAPTERLLDMLITLKAWELDPQDPAVVAAVVLCN